MDFSIPTSGAEFGGMSGGEKVLVVTGSFAVMPGCSP